MAKSETDQTSSDEIKSSNRTDQTESENVGDSVEKVDGRGLVTGRAKYADDIPTEDALEVKILRSPHAHARIESIDTNAVKEIDGVHTIMTRENAPSGWFSRTGFPRPAPTPYDERLFDTKVRYGGQAVAAIAAETLGAAERAIDDIEVEYEVLDHVLDPEEAMDSDAPTIHDQDEYVNPQTNADPDQNIVAQMEHERGDIKAGFQEADHVVKGEYESQIVQQAPMEMNTTIAWIDDRDRLVLRTSTQISHLAKAIIAETFDLPLKDVRVIKPRVGGGFGVKQDVVPSQFIAAALALETGETVRIENTREEDLHVAQTRHSVRTRVKTGVTEDGTITANKVDVVSNSGAHGGHGPTTLSSGAHEALGLYPRASLRFEGVSVYTNAPPGGAFRGYGSVQVTYAVESNIKEVADEIGMDSLELRRKNCVQTGDEPFESPRVATEGPIQSCGLLECLEKAANTVGWEDGTRQDDEWERGFGISLAMHKSGVPRDELAGAEITLEADGTFTLMMGVGDAGQGAETTMAQIAAGVLNVPTSRINIRADDTDTTPYDNGAYASSTTYVSGQAAEKAAIDLLGKIKDVAGRTLDGDPDNFEVENGCVMNPAGEELSLPEVAAIAAEGRMGPKTQLHGYAEHYTGHSPKPFAAQIAEVKVDIETGDFEVVQLVNAVDCGYAINPENARGQVIGGAIMGLGQAISEELTFDNAGITNVRGLKDYDVLRSSDVPENVESILVEPYEPTGPFGAKSVGEVTNIGPLAAVANAVKDAVGVRVSVLPVTKEKIMSNLDETS